MGDTFSIGVLIRLVVSLAILIGALYAVKYWQRRPGGAGRRSDISVVARANLGRNSSVHIIDVGDRRFLVGSGEHQVNLLSELDQPPDAAPADGEQLPSNAGDPAHVPGDLDGSGIALRTRPRIGPMDWLRTVTVRTPQHVRVIRDRVD